MADLPNELRRYFERGAPTAPDAILRRAYGGSTRAMAADLGVSQRTVQRWVAPAGRQRRRPSLSVRDRLAEAGAALIRGSRATSLARYGAGVRLTGTIAIGDPSYTRSRSVPAGAPQYVNPSPYSPTGPDWQLFCDLAREGNWSEAADSFLAAFAIAYGTQGMPMFAPEDDVRLEIRPG